MHLVTVHTLPLGNGLMHALHLGFFSLLPVADITLLRGIPTQINTADHTVMQVASLTIIFQNRLMHNPLFIGGSKIRMTFNTVFLGLFCRLAGNAGRNQTTRQ